MRTVYSSLLCLLLTLSFSTSAIAEAQEDKKEEVSFGKNSVNFSPLGLVFGTYSLTFEHLVNNSHGFIGEASYSSTSDDTSESSSMGGVLGYRWHWSGSQNSGFLGAMLGYSYGSGESTVVSNGVTKTFDLTITAPSVTFNIGRRWAWKSGFNLTLRFGVGRAFYDITSTSDDEDVQDGIQLVDDLLNAIPITLDGELSVGWIF